MARGRMKGKSIQGEPMTATTGNRVHRHAHVAHGVVWGARPYDGNGNKTRSQRGNQGHLTPPQLGNGVRRQRNR